jgi:hypothetical protein
VCQERKAGALSIGLPKLCQVLKRLSENAHLLRYPHPSSLRRTFMYASFLGISEALHMDIFHQPLRICFFDSL